MNLEELTTEGNIDSGNFLRRMGCGCITFSGPVKDDLYIVVRSCDDNTDYYTTDTDLRFFIRPFTENSVKDSTIVPAAQVWIKMNRLINDGITARNLRHSLSCLLNTK